MTDNTITLLARLEKRLEELTAELGRRDVLIAELRRDLGRWYDAATGLTEATPAEMMAERDEARQRADDMEAQLRSVLEQAQTENGELRARLALLEPVYRAAVHWRHFEGTVAFGSLIDPETTLMATIDAALAAEQKERDNDG